MDPERELLDEQIAYYRARAGEYEGVHERWREDWIDPEAGIVRRPLTDGSVHRAVKVLWRADELVRRLSELGWDASVTSDGPFYWGTAIR
jgi:hypothetical protein